MLSNLGDCLVELGEARCAHAAAAAGAEVAFREATAAYEHACSVSDSAQGDDLPSLLVNWGVGLFKMAEWAVQREAKLQLLAEAAQRLQAAADFDRCVIDRLSRPKRGGVRWRPRPVL